MFGDGNNLPSIIAASLCLWLIHLLVLTGIRQAAFINVITTVAKLVPIALFIVVAVIAFNWDKLTFDWGQAAGLGSITDQVKSTMLVALWVFIGIEGASVYSSPARFPESQPTDRNPNRTPVSFNLRNRSLLTVQELYPAGVQVPAGSCPRPEARQICPYRAAALGRQGDLPHLREDLYADALRLRSRLS
jgi:hypothetical protein